MMRTIRDESNQESLSQSCSSPTVNNRSGYLYKDYGDHEKGMAGKELSAHDLYYDEYIEGKFNGAFEHDTSIFTKL